MVAKSLLSGIILALALVLLFVTFYPHATDTESTPGSPRQVLDAEAIPNQSVHGLTGSKVSGDRTDDQAGSLADTMATDTAGLAGKIEIYGRVTDDNNQPLDGVLIADEINLGSAGSNPDGSYRISIEQPKFKTPVLLATAASVVVNQPHRAQRMDWLH